MAWWDLFKKLYDVSGLDTFVQSVYGDEAAEPPAVPLESTQARLWHQVLTNPDSNPFFAFERAVTEAWEKQGGWRHDPYVEYRARQLARIDPHVFYGLYHGLGQTGTTEDKAAWLPAFAQAVTGPLGEAMGVRPAQTTYEAAALMALNLAPGQTTMFSQMLQDSVRNDDILLQYQLLRDAVDAALLDVYDPVYRGIVLRRLDDLFYQYQVDRDNGSILAGMSYVEYVAVKAADTLQFFFPGLRWDQVDDLWAAWRADTAKGTAENQAQSVPMEGTPSAPAEASAATPAPAAPPPTAGQGATSAPDWAWYDEERRRHLEREYGNQAYSRASSARGMPGWTGRYGP